MYDTKIRLLVRAFVDAESVRPDPETISTLLRAVDDDRFAALTGFESRDGRRTPRIVLTAEDLGVRLILGSESFDASWQPTDVDASNIGELEEFCALAAALIGRSLTALERRSHRLATVQEGFIARSEEGLAAVTRTFMPLATQIIGSPPFEWDWRAASTIERRIGELLEPTNTLVTVKRGRAGLQGEAEVAQEFPDRLRVDLDINTKPENRRPRFGPDDISIFMKLAPAWHKDLASNVLPLLEVENERG